MTIPSYQEFMLPVLRFAADGEYHRTREAYEAMAEEFALSDEERRELLPSGGQPVYTNRIGWALSYLRQAGLLDSPKRGWFSITDDGRKLLEGEPWAIDVDLLKQYPAFLEFLDRTRSKSSKVDRGESAADADSRTEQTPEDQLSQAWSHLQRNLQAEILDHVKVASPEFFEHLVVDVLLAMGYGGSRVDAGRALGQGGDEGIDGLIKEDRLGLEVIYLQAKRWQGVVGRPEIQRFAGALQGKRAKKGVFLTTSRFTQEAVEYAAGLDTRIILVDGEELADLMIEHDVGVSLASAYPVKKIDTDYFVEE